MGWVFLWLSLAAVTQIWLCFRVARSSVLLAVGTFFLGGIAAAYTLFKERDDPETNVTVPFIANLACSLLLVISGWQVIKTTMLEEADVDEAPVVAQADGPDAPTLSAAMPMAARVETPASAQAPAPTPEPTPVPRSTAALDSVDAYSAELHRIGIEHAVTRKPATAKLPAGVVDSAQVDVQALTSGPNATGGPTLSVTLFRCHSTPACRDVAGSYMHQSARRARVVQNGATLLVLPVAGGGELDGLQANMVGAFRKLSL
jgi:hypothetical protein